MRLRFFWFVVCSNIFGAKNFEYLSADSVHQALCGFYYHAAGNLYLARLSLTPLAYQYASPSLYRGYAQLIFDEKDFFKLTSLHEILALLLPRDRQTILYLAQAYEQRDSEKACFLYEQLMADQSVDVTVTYHAARFFLERGQSDRVLTLIDSLMPHFDMRTDQRCYSLYFLKAQAYEQRGEGDLAMAATKKALALNPNFGYGWLLSGALQEQQGKHFDAADQYEKFVDLMGATHALAKKITDRAVKNRESGTLLDQAYEALKKGRYEEVYELCTAASAYKEDIERVVLAAEALRRISDEHRLHDFLIRELEGPTEDLCMIIYLLFRDMKEKKRFVQRINRLLQKRDDKIIKRYAQSMEELLGYDS